MPWNVSGKDLARRRFVEEWLASKNESFVALCRRHGVARSCGYKWVERFCRNGRAGLEERSRRPQRAERCQRQWQARLRLASLQERDFGPKKLHWKLRRDYPRSRVPCVRTLARWLALWGRTRSRVRRPPAGPRVRVPGRLQGRCANDVWTIDFKGRFHTGDGHRVMALTVRDLASRYVLCVRHLAWADERCVREVMDRLFRRYGLPRAIRMDNGGPFGGGGPRGWTRLSVPWVKLGIRTEYGRPRHPEDNAQHEQMHRELKARTARPASCNLAAQQRRFERWRQRYNHRRPHESLGQRTPAECYRPSLRMLPDEVAPWTYPAHWQILRPDTEGRCYWQRRQRLIGQAFAHELLGVRALRAGVHAVYFRQHLIGTLHIDDRAGLRPVRRPQPGAEREGLRPSQHPPRVLSD